MISWPEEQPTLSAPGIRLRPVLIGDAESIYNYCQDWSCIEYTELPYPYDFEHATAAIERWQKGFTDRACMQFAITRDGGEMLGHVSIHNIVAYDHYCEIGYILAPAARGEGLATAAVNRLTEYAFSIGMRRVQAVLVQENQKSAAVLERSGYQREAVLRKAMTNRDDSQSDGLLYAKVRD